MNSAPERSPGGNSLLRVALFGASGRMGRAISLAVGEHADLRVCGACVSPTSATLGRSLHELHGLAAEAGGDVRTVHDAAQAVAGADVAIDFSLPAATPACAEACASAGCALVSGVTGLDDEALAALDSASQRVPVLHGRNMSLGVNLLALALRTVAAHLPGGDYDAEIHEFHHRAKRDAPSGTALMLGEAIAAARGDVFEEVRAQGVREGERQGGQIGFAVSRGGDVAGEHTVTFAGNGERLELGHRASGRDGFARGAVLAARWLAGRDPGRYQMSDVFSL